MWFLSLLCVCVCLFYFHLFIILKCYTGTRSNTAAFFTIGEHPQNHCPDSSWMVGRPTIAPLHRQAKWERQLKPPGPCLKRGRVNYSNADHLPSAGAPPYTHKPGLPKPSQSSWCGREKGWEGNPCSHCAAINSPRAGEKAGSCCSHRTAPDSPQLQLHPSQAPAKVPTAGGCWKAARPSMGAGGAQLPPISPSCGPAWKHSALDSQRREGAHL